MSVALNPETLRLIEERMRRGGYASADDVVRAALASLDQQADFEPGELDWLLAVADAEIDRDELLDGEEVFREIRGLGRVDTGQ
jgi:Arc/MetJ-type ribon-helix-helix transcriptional regulator